MDVVVAVRAVWSVASVVFALGCSGCEQRSGVAAQPSGDRAKDVAVWVPANDPERAATAARVQERLPAVAAAFQKGIPAGDAINVKAPFATDDGNVEWMWVRVTAFDGPVVRGLLNNQPARVSRLALGAPVEVKMAEIVDYEWWTGDGVRREGGRVSGSR